MKEVQSSFFGGRRLAWFSCGAASACCAKLAVEEDQNTLVIYCNSQAEEHEDNARFRADCEQWIGKPITVISSSKYSSPTEVFEATRYMSGPDGARCTAELKKIPRMAFQYADDVHFFGFTADSKEIGRKQEFELNNPDMFLRWILIERGITKQDCYRMVMRAGIKLPWMYRRGYPNNNCKCCVKATSPGYWNKCRTDFPALFKTRAEQSRRIGCRLVKLDGQRIFLDELPPDRRGRWKDEEIKCGPECGVK